MNLYVGIAKAVLRHECGEQRFDHLRRGSNPQDSGPPALEGARPRTERFGLRQQAAATPKEVFAVRCQSKAAADAVEKLHAQFAFQRDNLARRGGLAQVQTIARLGNAAGVSDEYEGTQMTEIHLSLILFAARRFWGRLWDDLLEGRMRQAERLIRTHSWHHVYWLHTPSAPASGPMTPGKGEPR
jgi:hypothetical protein